jgi:hypothetical protein
MMSVVIEKDFIPGEVCTPPCTPTAKEAQRPRKTFGEPVPSVPHQMDEEVRAQFRKTELCLFYPRCRKGDACPFAHSEEERRVRPDLSKTSLCQDWENDTCLLSASECGFAHGYTDMRRTMPVGTSPLKSAKIREPAPLHGDATAASSQAEQMPHNLFGQDLHALGRKYADMQRSSDLLNQQIQEIKQEMCKLSTGSADARPVGSFNATKASETFADFQRPCTNTRPTGLAMMESVLAERELQVARLHPWHPWSCPAFYNDTMHPMQAAAAVPVHSQAFMVAMHMPMSVPMVLPAGLAMCQGQLSNLLSSAVPDHYED